ALGAAGLARGYNLVRGGGRSSVSWSDESLDTLAVSALLGYLAVAHYGRGRGDWSASEHPPHWEAALREALAPSRDALHALWSRRDPQDEATLRAGLQRELTAAARRLLERLYPATVPDS
ncbi:MAG TPA: DUF3482 domain-containing protein, partial [Alphaproteobacteria bacterium]|nr:DUF3482 domain-containing protein [Alphaproteobacteria bacterium]